MKYYFFSESGKRAKNEDVILIEKLNQNANLFLIVDGMGGYQKGEIAAQIIAENIVTYLRTLSVFGEQDIENAIRKANLALKQFNAQQQIKSGGTVGGILLDENIAYCFWVGDVKIFHFKNNKLKWQSESHTLLNELFGETVNKSPELKKRYGHIVTRSVSGKRENFRIEVYKSLDIDKIDSYVICSDGVHNIITTEHISLFLSENNSVNEIQKYLSINSEDNFSFILVKP